MHDLRALRADPAAFDAALARRGIAPVSAEILALDEERRAAQTALQEKQTRRRKLSKEIGNAKREIDRKKELFYQQIANESPFPSVIEDDTQGTYFFDENFHQNVIRFLKEGEIRVGHRYDFNMDGLRNYLLDAGVPNHWCEVSIEHSRSILEGINHCLEKDLIELDGFEKEAIQLREDTVDLEVNAQRLEVEVRRKLEVLPNVLDTTVPDGPDESANVVVHEWGTRKNFSFTPRQHFELGETITRQGQPEMDFATAARLSGARFVLLRGGIARLARALGQFMLDLHVTEHGYTETQVPVLVGEPAMYGTDKLPKFADQSFATTDGRWLVPTAEVPLTASVMGEMLDGAQLPLRMTALSLCFRSEAGSAGRDVRGMLRQHQFEKVEMVSVTMPEESEAEHERMTRCAERVLELLDIPYRRMLLCAGDTGFGAAKTFDLEAWLPGQQAWREISSCSNTRDFQARRMNARFRPQGGGSPAFVHTLNGSGLAVGRTLIAVMENWQNEDGSITVPPVLRSYMGGVETLS